MKETNTQHSQNVQLVQLQNQNVVHFGPYSKVFIMWRIKHILGMLRNKYVDNEL